MKSVPDHEHSVKQRGYQSDAWSVREEAFRKKNENKKSEQEANEGENDFERKVGRKAYLHAASTASNHGESLLYRQIFFLLLSTHKSRSLCPVLFSAY